MFQYLLITFNKHPATSNFSLTASSTNPQCAAFLDLDRFQSLGLIGNADNFECPGCSTSLCPNCKTASHRGLSCAAYMALPEEQRSTIDAPFFEMARLEGLARCNQCRAVVQLAEGCNHITCPCRYQFCYPCGALWKTCACPLYDESRLR